MPTSNKPQASGLVSDLRDILQQDKRFLRVRKHFAEASTNTLPLSRLYEEVRSLHKMKFSRKLYLQDPKILEKMQQAALEDQSFRSRMVEVAVEADHVSRLLTELLESLCAYIMAEYDHKFAGIRTKGERQSAIQAALSKYYEYVAEVKSLLAVANRLIEDIDKAAYRFSDLVKLVQITTRPER